MILDRFLRDRERLGDVKAPFYGLRGGVTTASVCGLTVRLWRAPACLDDSRRGAAGELERPISYCYQ
jgi:hypothetical protein